MVSGLLEMARPKLSSRWPPARKGQGRHHLDRGAKRIRAMPTENPTPQPPDQSIVPEAQPKPTARPARKRRWRVVAAVLLLVAALLVGIPRILRALNTVSTDDAYVNGYVTFVAPRVSGQGARVLVDDNYRVKKGDVLVELDPEPFQVQVAIKQAAVDTAQANLVVAQASVRGLLGQPRSKR